MYSTVYKNINIRQALSFEMDLSGFEVVNLSNGQYKEKYSGVLSFSCIYSSNILNDSQLHAEKSGGLKINIHEQYLD